MADKGIIEGYPYKEFKGDSTMTWHEFVGMIYKILKDDINVDARLV